MLDLNLTRNQDLLMDWSLLQSHSTRRFLRPELLYGDYFPVSLHCVLLHNSADKSAYLDLLLRDRKVQHSRPNIR